MVIVKLEKPSLKTHVIKIEPDFSDSNSTRFSHNNQDSSGSKVIKIITTRSKKPTKPKPTTEEEDADHLIGKGMIGGKPFYLYFSKTQSINEARWVDAMHLRKNCKASLIRRILFEGRLALDSKSQLSRVKPFIDREYIEKHLEKKNKARRSVKSKAQELESKFYYDFEVLKIKMTTAINEIFDLSSPQGIKSTPKNVVQVKDDLKQEETSPAKMKKQSSKTVIKVEDDSVENIFDSSLESSIEKSYQKSSKSSNDKSNEKLFSFRPSSSQIKVKNSQNQQSRQQKFIDEAKENGVVSFSSSSFDSFSEHKSISFSQKKDFSKQEVTNVEYVGKIKEREGNFENLYRFTLLYHPDIYSTMKMIKQDDFLRNAFMKFAESLYEQYKK